jgi:hypothetical protein
LSAATGVDGQTASVVPESEWLDLSPAAAVLADSRLVRSAGTLFAPWPWDCNPLDAITDGPRNRLVLTLRAGTFVSGIRNTFLRLLDSILAALCLMLVRARNGLSARPNALTFLLVMLAACLRYGRHSEPDDHAFLPPPPISDVVGKLPTKLASELAPQPSRE